MNVVGLERRGENLRQRWEISCTILPRSSSAADPCNTVYPRTKKRIDGSSAWMVAAMLWSMSRIPSFRKLLATGKAEECCALVDVMTAAALLSNPPALVSSIQTMKPL